MLWLTNQNSVFHVISDYKTWKCIYYNYFYFYNYFFFCPWILWSEMYQKKLDQSLFWSITSLDWGNGNIVVDEYKWFVMRLWPLTLISKFFSLDWVTYAKFIARAKLWIQIKSNGLSIKTLWGCSPTFLFYRSRWRDWGHVTSPG